MGGLGRPVVFEAEGLVITEERLLAGEDDRGAAGGPGRLDEGAQELGRNALPLVGREHVQAEDGLVGPAGFVQGRVAKHGVQDHRAVRAAAVDHAHQLPVQLGHQEGARERGDARGQGLARGGLGRGEAGLLDGGDLVQVLRADTTD